MKKFFVPFGPFTPDTPEVSVGDGSLRHIENILPIAGTRRSLRRFSTISSLQTTYGVGGGISLLSTGQYPPLKMLPIEDGVKNQEATMSIFPAGGSSDFYPRIDETSPNDADGFTCNIYGSDGSSWGGNNPSAIFRIFPYGELNVAPTEDDSLVMRMRYYFGGAENTSTFYALKFEFGELVTGSFTPRFERNISEGSSNAQDEWLQAEFTATPAEFALISDYVNNFWVRVTFGDAAWDGGTPPALKHYEPNEDLIVDGWETGDPTTSGPYSLRTVLPGDDGNYQIGWQDHAGTKTAVAVAQATQWGAGDAATTWARWDPDASTNFPRFSIPFDDATIQPPASGANATVSLEVALEEGTTALGRLGVSLELVAGDGYGYAEIDVTGTKTVREVVIPAATCDEITSKDADWKKVSLRVEWIDTSGTRSFKPRIFQIGLTVSSDEEGKIYPAIDDTASPLTNYARCAEIFPGQTTVGAWGIEEVVDPASDGYIYMRVMCRGKIGSPDPGYSLYVKPELIDRTSISGDDADLDEGTLIYTGWQTEVGDEILVDQIYWIPLEAIRDKVLNWDKLAIRLTVTAWNEIIGPQEIGGEPATIPSSMGPEAPTESGGGAGPGAAAAAEETLGPSRYIELYLLNVTTPPQVFYAISMISGEAEYVAETYPADRPKIYVGTEGKIWSVRDDAWTDVTRSLGDYGNVGNVNVLSKGWDFCSWGGDVIGTNFADLPQVLPSGSARFEDIIDPLAEPDAIIPMAKYCAVVGEQLVLADINPGSPNITLGNGVPYSMYWSEIGNYRKFQEINLTGQASYKLLTSTDGQIQRLVGGEYGLVFKRNSIFRMSYVGLPTIFNFDPLAKATGTPFQKSVVVVGGDVYFWGNAGIFRVVNGASIEKVSSLRVDKFLFDCEYEEYAVKQADEVDPRVTDKVVVGAYDHYSNLVWWAYAGKNDIETQKSMALVYSPEYNEFAFVKSDGLVLTEPGGASGLNLDYILSRQNVMTSELHYNKGILAFQQESPEAIMFLRYGKFSSPRTYQAVMKTKTLSGAEFPDTEPGDSVQLNRCRVIYRGTPFDNDVDYKITVQAGEEPTMQLLLEPAQTVYNRNKNRDGWISFEPTLEGEFFDVTVECPALSSHNIKDFIGLQFEYRSGGEN